VSFGVTTNREIREMSRYFTSVRDFSQSRNYHGKNLVRENCQKTFLKIASTGFFCIIYFDFLLFILRCLLQNVAHVLVSSIHM